MKQEQLILNNRPDGLPDDHTFQFKEVDIDKPGANEVLLKTLYVSVDPYMRGRMSDTKSYVAPFQVEEPLEGGVVAEVTESNSEQLQTGDIVRGNLPFQTYHIVTPEAVSKVNTNGLNPSAALSVLGMPGLTAYFGMMHIGKPQTGETVVVSAAAGAVGQVAGQLAKQAGARVVGIVGSQEKADHITGELGYDAAVQHKEGNVQAQLANACPDGIDVYYENVGGEIGDAVLPLLNTFARIPVCGAISSYNLKDGEKDIGLRVQPFLVKSRVKMQGLLVGDFSDYFDEAYEFLAKAVSNGDLTYEETIKDGFHAIPEAFLGLFSGDNIGKQLVKVADPS